MTNPTPNYIKASKFSRRYTREVIEKLRARYGQWLDDLSWYDLTNIVQVAYEAGYKDGREAKTDG